MTKKILVVPDIHGETFWKKPVQKYIYQVDKVIFLGDYLDPYRNEGKEYSQQEIFNNLMAIVDFKRDHMDKVVLSAMSNYQDYVLSECCLNHNKKRG